MSRQRRDIFLLNRVARNSVTDKPKTDERDNDEQEGIKNNN